MKKIFIGLLWFFVLGGTIAETVIGNDYLEKPKISIEIGHSYNYSSWSGEEFEITTDQVKIAGHSFCLTIGFHQPIAAENIIHQIKLIGLEKPDFQIRTGDTYTNISCNVPEITNRKQYTLFIPKELQDLQGRTMQEDVKIDILADKDPLGYFSLKGADFTFENLETYMQCCPEDVVLTDLPKTFRLSFTADIDKTSVENALSKQLSENNLKYRFFWINNRKLQMVLSGFKDKKTYQLNLADAVDGNGDSILGHFSFSAGKPNKIVSMNLKTGKKRTIHQFNDMCIMAKPSTWIDKYFFISTGSYMFLYNRDSNKMSKTSYHPTAWWDSNSFLFCEQGRGLQIYSLATHKTKQIINKLPFPSKEEVIEYCPAPDRRKIALITYGDSYHYHLYIISDRGQLLVKKIDNIVGHPREASATSFSLNWLDNHYVVYENRDEKDMVNIMRVDANNGKKTVLIKNAAYPITFPQKNFMIFNRDYSNWFVYRDGKETKLSATGSHSYENFYFINDHQFAFNLDENIIIYDYSSKTQRAFGKGNIFGLSPDHNTLYYLTNYQNLSCEMGD